MIDELLVKLKCSFLPCEKNSYRPKFLDGKFLKRFIILLLVLKFVVIPFFIYFPKTGFFADLTKTSLIQLANLARQSLGYQPLAESQKLNTAAYFKAKDMLDKDYFAHSSPEGLTPWFWFGKAEYDYRYAGENLAIGFLESEEVNQAWLDSASHRKNILNANYSEIGLAVVSGEFQGKQTTVVVQLFGSPKTKAQTVAKTNSFVSEAVESATETTPAKVVSGQFGGQPQIVLSAFEGAEQKGSLAMSFYSFFVSDYYDLLQKIIFGFLIFVIILLINTVLFDIFIYRAYEIQYKDILLKTLGFCLILAILLHFDKSSIIQLIPHDFRIY
ncbi:MAG: CAP domain-containing protein [Parcubacteria group bacterium]